MDKINLREKNEILTHIFSNIDIYNKNSEKKLDIFLDYFFMLFPTLNYGIKNILETILINKYAIIYFKSNDNNKILIEKIILYNFIENLKVLGKYFNNYLLKHNIDYQKLSLNNRNDRKNLILFLQKVIEENNNLSIFYLFDNIYVFRKEKICNTSIMYFKTHWEILFDTKKQFI